MRRAKSSATSDVAVCADRLPLRIQATRGLTPTPTGARLRWSPVARCFNYDYGKLQAREILLVLKVAVDSEEDIELLFRETEQRAILDTRPSGLANGLDIVTQKVLP